MMKHLDIDNKLIQTVKRHPRLYSRFICGINVTQRRDAWMAVAQECDTPIEQCQSRWRTLRERYVREMNKPNPRGFPLFENLSFLQEHIKLRRKTISNPLDQPSQSYYIDEMTQVEATRSMIIERPVEKAVEEDQEREYLSDNADTSSVEFVPEELPIAIESSPEHTQPPPLPASNPNPEMEQLSAFAKVIGMLDQALKEKSVPAEPQDPFYKYLESMLSRVDESLLPDIQMRLLNFAYDEIKKATLIS